MHAFTYPWFSFPIKKPKHPVDKMEWIHNQAAAFIRFVLYRKRVFLIARKCLVQKLPLNDKPSYHILLLLFSIRVTIIYYYIYSLGNSAPLYESNGLLGNQHKYNIFLFLFLLILLTFVVSSWRFIWYVYERFWLDWWYF